MGGVHGGTGSVITIKYTRSIYYHLANRSTMTSVSVTRETKRGSHKETEDR